MPVSSVLIGAGGAGCTAAIALAPSGVEVTLVASAADLADAPMDTLHALRVEVREGVELVGSVAVDRHVEAELSDGRVENYDIVVTPSARSTGFTVIASRDVQDADAVAAVKHLLGAAR